MCRKFWWGEHGGKRPLGRPRRICDDYIKIGLEEEEGVVRTV